MSSTAAVDGGVAVPRISDVLRTPDDLQKISTYKAEFIRKKADVDARLKEGLKDHLETTQSGISTLLEGQKLVGQIKEELKSIHDLCEQAQAIRKDFPQIDYLARVHRNFEATKAMQAGLVGFSDDCNEVQRLLVNDEADLENQPNLLEAHMKLTRLRDFRDEALDQIKRAKDTSLLQTLEDWFQQLDEVVAIFDDHIGNIALNLISLVQNDNNGLIVRFAIVIAAEEKNDSRVRALQEAQKDHQELVSKFTSFTIGPKTIRGYKEKFLDCIKISAQTQFDSTRDAFLDEPGKLEKQTKWVFNDLFACRQGMQNLFPKKWKIFKTYVDIYHTQMHDFLLSFVDSKDIRPPHMLSIVHFIDEYYKKMTKLGIPRTELTPHVLDSRDAELVREYRNLITRALSQWIDRMYVADRKAFMSRSSDALDRNVNKHLRTKTLGDMWRMLHEQTEAAGNSEREDVVEGVMSAMMQALKSRQQQWERLIDDEVAKYKAPTAEQSETLPVLQDWLVAVANDQIACIDDGDAGTEVFSAQASYLTRFKEEFVKLQTPPSAKFLSTNATTEIEALRNGYVDLSTHCINCFVSLVFANDFRSVLPEFFVPSKWYEQATMKRITITFDDYISDYSEALTTSLVDVLIIEFSEATLSHYLQAMTTNKGVKFGRQDPFLQKMREDVSTAFEFFGKYRDVFDSEIKMRWRAVDFAGRLLETEKSGVVGVYVEFKRHSWDLQLSWVEALLKKRDDWDRSMIAAVKKAAASTYAERGVETIMGKVR